MAAKFMLRRFTVLAVVAVVLSDKPIDYWERSFDRIDTNDDQRVSRHEFRQVMQDMGWALNLKQQAEAFAAYAIEPNDGFSFSEFSQMWNDTLTYSGGWSPNVPVNVQFAQFDRNGDGALVLEEIISGEWIGGTRLPWTSDFYLQVMDWFDKYPKDGKIDMCELYTKFNDGEYDVGY